MHGELQSIEDAMRERWIRLWRGLNPEQEATVCLEWLIGRYSEPHRHYHTLQHIAECLREFDQAKHLAGDPTAVELAIWFHDAIYDPRAPDNEEKSAEAAKECLEQLGTSAGSIDRVGQLVLSTKDHDPARDADAPVMVDVDLSILGRPEPRFWEYEAQIRQEYAWVPEEVFATKRAEVLERFLSRTRIYITDWFFSRYERQARTNLQASIQKKHDETRS
jgi:predicted metal-dependent HD superfamily phosphohydrolase